MSRVKMPRGTLYVTGLSEFLEEIFCLLVTPVHRVHWVECDV